MFVDKIVKGATHCRVNLRRSPSQRWCLACHNASRRVQSNGLSEIPGAFPTGQNAGRERLGTTPGQTGAEWTRPPTPPAELQPLPSVADRWDGWRGVYLRHLVATGQRIKGCAIALRPLEYIERSASLSVSADLNQRSPITDAAAVELLKGMLANTTPATRRMLAGATLEDTPQPGTS